MKIQVAFCLVVACAWAVDPGVMVTIKETEVQQITKQVLPSLASKFGDITVPDQSSDHCDLSSITAKISGVDQNTVSINFDQAKNALDISTGNIQVGFSMHFHCHESFLSVSGDASASGPVSMSTQVELTTADAGNSLFVPQIAVPGVSIGLDKNQFSIHLNCHNCPGFIEDALESLIKKFALDAGRKAAEKALPGEITSNVNPKLASSYPKSEPVANYDMSFSTALTGPAVVKSDHLELPLDGVAYRTSTGYARSGSPGTLPGMNAGLAEGVQLGVSSFVLNSAFAVAKTIGIPIETNFHNYTIRGQLDQSSTSQVQFESGMVKFTGGLDLSVFALNSQTQLGALSSNVNLYLEAVSETPASEADAMEVKVQLRNLSFDSLSVTWGTTTFNLSWLRWPINAAVWLLTWFISYDDLTNIFDIAPVSFSAITLLKGDLILKSQYAAIGADVNFSGEI